ncbi:histidine kinase [Streptomyces sp. NA04227]|uniref:sensor histidine kinase n=1 Tax=Streptomyces sp. NA04227 TaxID=2742136 RepID=UPI00159198BC|nr:histidine kinase [Streptomyces sp. NA04227]QKW08797.1 histidine kinase [Streptomyces sp. NA04227]
MSTPEAPAGAGKRGPLWWSTWRSAVFDVLLWLSLTLATLPDLWSSVTKDLALPLRVLVVAIGVATALLTLVRRTRPVLFSLGALVAALIGGDLLMPFAAYALGRYRKPDRLVVGLVAVLALLMFGVLMVGPLPDLEAPDADEFWWTLAGTVTLSVAPALLGAHLRTRRRLVDQLRERAEQLERERHLLAAQALADERARIAREMHDVVAHQIGLVVVYSNVMDTAAGDDPEQLRELGRQMGASGRQALQELREVITVLRGTVPDSEAPERVPDLSALRGLVEESADAGLPVALRATGAERPLPGQVARSVFRITQESLTNVRKHAGLVPTDVTLHYSPTTVHLTVRNAAPRADTPAPVAVPSSGHGLIGMEERVQECRGRFHAGQTPDGGFEVRAELPTDGSGGQGGTGGGPKGEPDTAVL